MTTLEIWALAFCGWLGYNILVFYIEKNAADDLDKPFDYIHYYNTHWDNWIVTFLFAIPIVYWGPDLHSGIISKLFVSIGGVEIPWNNAYYAGPGVFVEMLVWGYKKLKQKLDKLD